MTLSPVLSLTVVMIALAAAGCSESAGQPLRSKTATKQDKAKQDKAQPPAKSVAPEWPSYRGNPALQGIAPGKLGDTFELAWSFDTKDAIVSSPVVATTGGVTTVYFGSGDQSVYAVDLKTGKKRWSYATADMVDAPPLVLDGRVYVGSSDFFFYVLDAVTGKLLWKFETQDTILGGANYARMEDGTTRVVVGSYDANIYCFDPGGKKIWTYETGDRINGTPAILGDRIVFGGCDENLHVVSMKTGKSIAQTAVGEGCYVAASVGLADNEAFFGHYGNAFTCIDLATGKPKWAYPSKRDAFFSSPAIAADRVVFGGRDKLMHCVKRSDGTRLWTFPTKRKIDGSAVICGDKVVFGSGDGRLYVLRLSDGKEVWKYEVGQAIFSSPAVAHGTILIGSNDGRLYAFRPPIRDAGSGPSRDPKSNPKRGTGR